MTAKDTSKRPCQHQPTSAASGCCSARGTAARARADLILGRFADAHLAGFDEAQLDRYEALLECADAEFFDWVAGRTAPPPEYDHEVTRLLARLPLTPPTT